MAATSTLKIRIFTPNGDASANPKPAHFIDRQALSDALAEQGFVRLTQQVSSALTSAGDVQQRFREVGHAMSISPSTTQR